MVRTPARRRQRGVRVTVAVTLLILATLVVLAALPSQSSLWLSLAAVFGMVCSWGAVRMMWTEVLQSRREHATDRAAQAAAYKSLFSQRAVEHAEFTSAMTERLAVSHLTQRELEHQLIAEQQRTTVSESAVRRITADLERSRRQVAELESSIEAGRAEEQATLDAWDSTETVDDLVERTTPAESGPVRAVQGA